LARLIWFDESTVMLTSLWSMSSGEVATAFSVGNSAMVVSKNMGNAMDPNRVVFTFFPSVHFCFVGG
jgi:hypothetical protein